MFDVDGTLIDSVDFHARAWQDALTDFGIACTFEQARRQVGKGADQILPVFIPEDQVETLGKQIVEHRLKLFEERYAPKLQAFPCVPELFAEAHRRGLRVALASSAKAEELDQYVQLIHVEGMVDSQVSSNDAKRSKPFPDIFLAAFHNLGLEPEETLVIGDTPYDGEAARSAGAPFVAVLCGGFPEEELRASGARTVVQDPCDLLRSLDAVLG